MARLLFWANRLSQMTTPYPRQFFLFIVDTFSFLHPAKKPPPAWALFLPASWTFPWCRYVLDVAVHGAAKMRAGMVSARLSYCDRVVASVLVLPDGAHVESE